MPKTSKASAETVLFLLQVAENAAAAMHGQSYPESLSKAAASQIPLQTKVQALSRFAIRNGMPA